MSEKPNFFKIQLFYQIYICIKKIRVFLNFFTESYINIFKTLKKTEKCP